MIKKCIECGAEFETPNRQRLLCGKVCAYKRRHRLEREQTKSYKTEITQSKCDIEKALRRAKRKGMSYAEMQKEETLRLVRKGKL